MKMWLEIEPNISTNYNEESQNSWKRKTQLNVMGHLSFNIDPKPESNQ
jgi:hypothetical protein